MVKTNAKKSAKYTMVNELTSKYARPLGILWWVLPTALLNCTYFLNWVLEAVLHRQQQERKVYFKEGVNEDFLEQGGERIEIRLEGEPLSVL